MSQCSYLSWAAVRVQLGATGLINTELEGLEEICSNPSGSVCMMLTRIAAHTREWEQVQVHENKIQDLHFCIMKNSSNRNCNHTLSINHVTLSFGTILLLVLLQYGHHLLHNTHDEDMVTVCCTLVWGITFFSKAVAMSRAVCPWGLAAPKSAPASSSTFTSSAWPPTAARMSGVWPEALAWLTLAPKSISTCATAAFPLTEAIWRSEVWCWVN